MIAEMFLSTTRQSEDLKNSVSLSIKSWLEEEVALFSTMHFNRKLEIGHFLKVRTAAVLNFTFY